MTIEEEIIDAVRGYVAKNDPVEQSDIVDEFGNVGLSSLRSLMVDNEICYTIDWKITIHSDFNNE